MCFSASASFAASSTLAASGYVISRVPKEKSEIPLSLIPIIFALHQFIEGILWLIHLRVLSVQFKPVAIYSYVFIAWILWPVYVPFAVYRTETHRVRRMIILICQFIGVFVSLTFLVTSIQNPVNISIVGHSFSYTVQVFDWSLAPYLFSVSIPFLVSSKKGLVFFGVALTLSCIGALIMATSSIFPSVWCFYAAILSASLYLYFNASAREVQLIPLSP